ncbi:hypothetical protein J1605_016229 [Eschrichtius robustus]|uniref:Uncharacterized protein n=1 Tax=Eschrichtius robustus TaxID=9764 RepID=A0AB34G7J1_ESCRO|nr:hypothetical protein J1605_016229 [Eschrichtius robustus]
MSQPGQKPAASPRPRRAAAARHTQEPCAKLGGAGSTRRGRADVGPAQVPPPLTAVGLEKLSASQIWGRWSASPAPAALHPVSSPGSPPRDSEQIGCHHGIRKLVVHDGFGGERVGTRCDVLSDFQFRLRERLRLTLRWYVRASSDVQVGVSRRTRLSSRSRVEWNRIVAGGIPPLDADSWMNSDSHRKSSDLVFVFKS